MMSAVMEEEKQERLKEAAVREQLNRAMTEAARRDRHKGGKRPTLRPRLSRADKALVGKQVHSVMKHVNNVAKRVTAKVLEFDSKGPPPAGTHKQITVTANTIASTVTSKLRRAKQLAKQIMAQARAKAAAVVSGAKAKVDAAHARERSWQLDMATLSKIPKLEAPPQTVKTAVSAAQQP